MTKFKTLKERTRLKNIKLKTQNIQMAKEMNKRIATQSK